MDGLAKFNITKLVTADTDQEFLLPKMCIADVVPLPCEPSRTHHK